MQEIDIALVKKRSLVGVVALVKRSFVITTVGFAAQLLFLSVFLDERTFGVFGLVNSFIAFLSYFSDIGLAAALIQKKDTLTQDDLSTTFTIQQGLVLSLIGISLLFTGRIAAFYGLDMAGVWLLRALLASFLFSSLKTIPSIILERELKFDKLIIPQILEQLVYSIVTVVLAWQGYGVWSFTWGVLARGVVGLISIYIIAPWRVRLGLRAETAKHLFRFGVPYQWNSFIALAKDDLLFLVLGRIIPLSSLGYIYWAKRWTDAPLRLVMDNAIRVTFPAFSRLQQHREHLRSAIEKTMFGVAAGVFPTYVGLMFFIQPLIHIVPRYEKWEPAVMSIMLLSATQILSSLSTPLTNTLNAIGKIQITLKFMIGWTIATWALTLLLTNAIGYNGYALALAIVSSSVILVVYIVRQIVPFSFFGSIRSPLFAAAAQAAFYAVVLRVGIQAPLWYVFVGGCGVLIYAAIVWMREKEQIRRIIAVYRSRHEA